MAFAGPKGGVTLSLLLTMPAVITSGELFPMREEILSLASGGDFVHVAACELRRAALGAPQDPRGARVRSSMPRSPCSCA